MGFQVEQERFTQLFQHTADGVVVIDQALRVVAMNPAAARLTTCSVDTTVGLKVCREVAICQNAEGFELCESTCPGRAALDRGAAHEHLDVNVPGRGGQVVPAACVPMTASDGAPLAMILIRDVSDRVALEEHILAVERVDRVSGLCSRAYFDELSRRELRLAERQQRSLAAVIISLSGEGMDSDSADQAIRRVAEATRESLRRVDIAGRYDHATFAVILLDADADGAASLVARIQDRFARQPLAHGVSIAYGVGTVATDGYAGLLKAARQSAARSR
ncbi:MAG: diguanylate cyclase [Nitrospirota bacterium]